MAGYPPQQPQGGNPYQQNQYPQQGAYPPQQGAYPQGAYPQQPYGQQGAYPGAMPKQGIPGTVIAGFILSFLCSLIGLILCIVGLQEAKRRNAGVGLATAGIIISCIMIGINILWTLVNLN